jgi:hypothetical protein
VAVFLPVAGTDVETVVRTARKITHYGRYGRLSFKDGVNTGKGVGEASGSPLVVDLEKLMTMRFGFQTLLFLFLFIPGTVLQAADMTLWDVAGKAEISLEQAAGEFPSPGIVYVGEFHDNAAHHAAQLAVIQSLDKRKRPIAVGLEMFQHIEQSILDAWVAQALSEEEMRRAFARNWSRTGICTGISSFIAETGASLWSA